MYRYVEAKFNIHLGTMINNPWHWYHSDEKGQREVAAAVKDDHLLEKRKI